jgi:tetratricopeptide (TPR) repeat protein
LAVAKDEEDILEIRPEDIIEEDADPGTALLATPPGASPARTEAFPPDDGLLTRPAPYKKQFADRIERLNRPREAGPPSRNQGWVFLLLAVVILFPVLLLWAIISHQQRERSKDEERAAFNRELRALQKQGDWGIGPHGPVNDPWAAQQDQLLFRQGMVAIANHDYDEAVRLLRLYLKDHKDPAAYSARGLAFYQKKEYEKAITDYSEAIRLNPTDARTINNLAWVLATCPDDKVRDGKRAIECATKACGLSNWRDFGYVDTLAAAYAEAGNFKDAVQWQKKALDLDIEDKENLEQAQQRLKLYEQGKPYRE